MSVANERGIESQPSGFLGYELVAPETLVGELTFAEHPWEANIEIMARLVACSRSGEASDNPTVLAEPITGVIKDLAKDEDGKPLPEGNFIIETDGMRTVRYETGHPRAKAAGSDEVTEIVRAPDTIVTTGVMQVFGAHGYGHPHARSARYQIFRRIAE